MATIDDAEAVLLLEAVNKELLHGLRWDGLYETIMDNFFWPRWFRQEPLPLQAFEKNVKRSTGTYGIFYTGRDLPDLYTQVRSPNCTIPVYIGESIGAGVGDRLNCHFQSTTDTGLGVHNFHCRWVEHAIWFRPEKPLIELFKPVLNGTGFGSRPAEDNRNNGATTSTFDSNHAGRLVASSKGSDKTKEFMVLAQKAYASKNRSYEVLADLRKRPWWVEPPAVT
jgi:hypothetical protein